MRWAYYRVLQVPGAGQRLYFGPWCPVSTAVLVSCCHSSSGFRLLPAFRWTTGTSQNLLYHQSKRRASATATLASAVTGCELACCLLSRSGSLQAANDAGNAQVIFALPSESGSEDYAMRIYNSDGSEPEMCGNGIRCLARFVADRDGSGPSQHRIATLAGAAAGGAPALLGGACPAIG